MTRYVYHVWPACVGCLAVQVSPATCPVILPGSPPPADGAGNSTDRSGAGVQDTGSLRPPGEGTLASGLALPPPLGVAEAPSSTAGLNVTLLVVICALSVIVTAGLGYFGLAGWRRYRKTRGSPLLVGCWPPDRTAASARM